MDWVPHAVTDVAHARGSEGAGPVCLLRLARASCCGGWPPVVGGGLLSWGGQERTRLRQSEGPGPPPCARQPGSQLETRGPRPGLLGGPLQSACLTCNKCSQ